MPAVPGTELALDIAVALIAFAVGLLLGLRCAHGIDREEAEPQGGRRSPHLPVDEKEASRG